MLRKWHDGRGMPIATLCWSKLMILDGDEVAVCTLESGGWGKSAERRQRARIWSS